ncbi:MAG: FkbM family methyltransferase [Syntrophales bacterium]|jgi:FkbM family methyltransferase|nr:FkbM family methyltransferase [Syntrophales bacterium]MCK9527541.1 FkbM family methyltransferase [Syntrophales bacterium]MDX9922598.1 FkbM family methyltransferase [Syntrophales bacterium]
MNVSNRIARLFGYELINRKRQVTPDSHIIQLISLCRVDLVLDVGANTGAFAKKLRQEGYRSEIHSFEPVHQTFEILRKESRNDDLWHVYKLALGNSPGRQSINITASSDFASFLDPGSLGKELYKEVDLSGKETVDVSTVDDFLAAHIGDVSKKRIFLKMDTQGYDLKVFDGARRSVPHIVCMMSELSMIPIYAGMPHYHQALRHYEDHGFAITGLFPVSRKEDMSLIEVDCTLINTSEGTQ